MITNQLIEENRKLQAENKEMFMAMYSARFLLEDLNNESGMREMEKLTGMPMGVIVDAFETIFKANDNFNKNNLR